MNTENNLNRRNFLLASGGLFGGLSLFPESTMAENHTPKDADINIIGKKNGYTTQCGAFISMSEWVRDSVLRATKDLSQKDLDYLFDDKSNTIGSMLFHLAATERFYQVHTFEGRKWFDVDKKDEDKFKVAMVLGDNARDIIKGNNLAFYHDLLSEVHEKTLSEFKNRDDSWFMAVDEKWSWGPTNNYCKWFHVCEHEANHRGQITWIKKRLSK